MLTVESPEYSFITLSETEPLPETYYESEICLPILEITELVFMIRVITDEPVLLNDFHVLVNNVEVAVFTWYEVGSEIYAGVITWNKTTAEIKALVVDNCFTLVLDYPDGTEGGTHFENLTFQNCFVFVDDVRYTALVQYYNTCSEFDFDYSTGGVLYNQLRLNMFMAFPEVSSKRKIYRKSNGSFKRLSTINDKRWAMQTDYFTERQFMCLVQATEHNFFQVQDEREQWHRLFMPEGETIKPDWQKQIGLNFRVTQCSWTMVEDYNASISLLCGTSCYTSASYMDEPIGGEL